MHDFHQIVRLPWPDIPKQREEQLSTENVQQQRKDADHLEEESDPRYESHDVRVSNVVQEILNSLNSRVNRTSVNECKL